MKIILKNKSELPIYEQIEQQMKELESRIKMAFGDAEALTAPGGSPAKPVIIATWKAAKDSQKFSEKEFAAAEPALYESYLKTVPGSRRFLLK